jgi:hypothetical protein
MSSTTQVINQACAVTGIDVDAAFGVLVETTLHESGHRQCRFRAAALTGDAPVPGCDVRAGIHLPQLFARAGAGEPDGSDVAGRVEPLATGHMMLEQVFRSVLAVAVACEVTDERHAAPALAALH